MGPDGLEPSNELLVPARISIGIGKDAVAKHRPFTLESAQNLKVQAVLNDYYA